jgi:hypothetical protein
LVAYSLVANTLTLNALQMSGDIYPLVDNAYNIGETTLRFANVYANNLGSTATPIGALNFSVGATGATAAPLTFYSEESTAVSWTGPFSTVSNILVRRVGKQVTITSTGTTPVSSAASAAFTCSQALAAAYRPTTLGVSIDIPTVVTANGTLVTGVFTIGTNGVMVISNAGKSPFPSSQVAGFNPFSVTYAV